MERWTNKAREPNYFCKKVSYHPGDANAYECGAATEGKVYCPSCAHKLLTLTDRQSPEQPAPKAYAWSNDQLIPRKRA
jgi:hypothetical protein